MNGLQIRNGVTVEWEEELPDGFDGVHQLWTLRARKFNELRRVYVEAQGNDGQWSIVKSYGNINVYNGIKASEEEKNKCLDEFWQS